MWDSVAQQESEKPILDLGGLHGQPQGDWLSQNNNQEQGETKENMEPLGPFHLFLNKFS